jgi:hypothetical protein
MASLPHEARRLQNELPRRPRVPRLALVMITASLVAASVSLGLVLGHRRSPALEAYGRLFSRRTWQILEAVSFLFLIAMTAIARAKRRDRT